MYSYIHLVNWEKFPLSVCGCVYVLYMRVAFDMMLTGRSIRADKEEEDGTSAPAGGACG